MDITFTKKSVKKIGKWLKNNGFNVKCSRIEDDDSPAFIISLEDEMYILLPKHYDEEPDEMFMKCLRDLGMKSDFDATTLSILHELGHAQTYPLFTEKEWESFNEEKDVINERDGEEAFFDYWNVKNELAANRWLVMFADCCPQKVQELENIIEKYVKFG